MSNRLIAFLVAAIFWAIPAYSHHAASSRYLSNETISVAGVVRQFRLINPHARIYFDVTDSTGKVEPWLAEGRAAGILRRIGWTENTLNEGDFIKITGHPARDGANALEWSMIILDDGRELRGGNPDAEELQRRLEELDERRE